MGGVMSHDPERNAAAYLAGELNRPARAKFEQHLVDCERCWREVQAGRAGRTLAESLRETAPAPLRDRIRAVASVPPMPTPTPALAPAATFRHERPGRSFRPYLLGIAAATVGVVALVLAFVIPDQRQAQPAPIVAAATLLEHGVPKGNNSAAAAPPTRRIGAFDWTGSTTRNLAGVAATVHSYVGPAGHHLLVITSRELMPRATGARDIAPAPSWIATVNAATTTVTMICADQGGMFWLAVAADAADARSAGRALGLIN